MELYIFTDGVNSFAFTVNFAGWVSHIREGWAQANECGMKTFHLN